MQKTKKGDFIELLFTGKAQDRIFDSNIAEDLALINPKATPKPLKIIIGEGMVVKGLDTELENKELNKKYKAAFSFSYGFGPRIKEFVKTIPLSVYTKHQINPKPGMPVLLDNNLARVITVSGARVITDFNNPLAGKDLEYNFTITRIIQEEKEKYEVFFESFFRHTPDFEIKDKEVVVRGKDWLENFVKAFKEKFRDLFSKELVFELKKEDK